MHLFPEWKVSTLNVKVTMIEDEARRNQAEPDFFLPFPYLSLFRFCPSSGLLLALVPHHLLPIILSQYETLPEIPSSVATELIRSNVHALSKELPPDQKKALRVRGRIDFRKWGWLKVEGEGEEVLKPSTKSDESTLPPPELTKATPSSSSSSSSPGTSKGGRFAHVDQKLSARNARRNSTRKSSQEDGEEGSTETGDAGFAIDEEKLGDGTLFLVIVRRGLEGMERYEQQGM
ncbi:hypothetical protein BDY24DRAFT_391869 [Mrakia frigida]|uniref:uncharacterized protein n=1 Tax=Mrakia frigida TaxID=29902 RepID=UPI003FCBFA23